MRRLDIKLITSDIDGTLIPVGGKISEATRRAVKMCREQGIAFGLASGRWYPSTASVAEELGANGALIVAGGGCVITAQGEILKELPMRDEDVRTAYNIIKDCGAMVTSYVRGAIYRLNTQVMGQSGPPERLSYFGGNRYEVIDNDPARFEAEAMTGVYKMEVYSNDASLLARVRPLLAAENLSLSSAFPTNIEITSAGLGKGAALLWLAEHMGIPREQTMAFGDNTNDLQQIEAAGIGVAVGNAVDALKNAADIVCGRCEDDGLANFLFENVLE